ncbi:hypothetical protein SAY87_019597 [Trapa incisa]|uniref:Peptidoglycan binding-like domain-containing protein n=1 Tax=Trapa incisa TaxID=236973 RepID=A0AAN7Q2D8_9MYRT|nr:hypothetical protein SAY87_019597 [Trapa incisa]
MSSLWKQVSSFFFFFFLLITACIPYCLAARIIPENKLGVMDEINNATFKWFNFFKFTDAVPGSNTSGLSEIKEYLHQFGYLVPESGVNFTDEFDAELQSAVATYQRRTRKVDLTPDDVEGIQTLYGPNPAFKIDSLPKPTQSASYLPVAQWTNVPIKLIATSLALVLTLSLPKQ